MLEQKLKKEKEEIPDKLSNPKNKYPIKLQIPFTKKKKKTKQNKVNTQQANRGVLGSIVGS